MNKITSAILSICLIFNLAAPAHSAIRVKEVGTVKLQNILQALRNLVSNNNEGIMIKDLEYIQDELQGHYGWGDEFMGNGHRTNRRWSPSEFQELLSMYGRGSADTRVDQIMAHFEQLFPIYSIEQYNSTDSEQGARKAKYWSSLEKALGSNSAMALRGTERVRDLLGEFEILSTKIEEAINQKSAADLNGKMVAQVGLALAELTAVIASSSAAETQSNRGLVEAAKAHADFLQVKGLGKTGFPTGATKWWFK